MSSSSEASDDDYEDIYSAMHDLDPEESWEWLERTMRETRDKGQKVIKNCYYSAAMARY